MKGELQLVHADPLRRNVVYWDGREAAEVATAIDAPTSITLVGDHLVVAASGTASVHAYRILHDTLAVSTFDGAHRSWPCIAWHACGHGEEADARPDGRYGQEDAQATLVIGNKPHLDVE
jgi:hypothetical protein